MNLNHSNITICRVCMAQNGTLKSIFSLEEFSERTLQINEVITTCASVQVEIGDGLPQEICTECLMRLRNAYAFKNLCEETDNTLRNDLKVDIKLEIEDVLVDIKQENLNECTKNDVEEEEVVRTKTPLRSSKERMRAYRARKKASLTESSESNVKKDEELRKHKSRYKKRIEKPYICEICGMLLANRASWAGHKRHIHASIRLPTCSYCRKTFPDESSLVVHRKSHAPRKKSYKCSECGKSFLYPCALAAHERVHTGERPFGCLICTKRFKTITHMRTHTKTHTGEKSIKCRICGMLFSNYTTLKSHNKKQHSTTESSKD